MSLSVGREALSVVLNDRTYINSSASLTRQSMS